MYNFTFEETLERERGKVFTSDMSEATLKSRKHHENVLKALEKQIPKKPKKDDVHYICPSDCDTWLLYDDEIPNDNDNYCPCCGQAIDWSEVEERL